MVCPLMTQSGHWAAGRYRPPQTGIAPHAAVALAFIPARAGGAANCGAEGLEFRFFVAQRSMERHKSAVRRRLDFAIADWVIAP